MKKFLSALLLAGVACAVPSASLFAAPIKYPITIISGTTTGYVDTVILPAGMIVSNLPGGGSLLVATNLTTGASSGGSSGTVDFAASSNFATNSGSAAFSTTGNYATNAGTANFSAGAGTATFASNSGSLGGVPAYAYATNFVGLTFYVRKEGKDTNTGAKENDPLLTLSNAVSRTTSNVNPITTYSFGGLSTANLTNKTFTFNGTTLTWLGTTNAANQILIVSTGSTSQKTRSNLTNLMMSVSNNISLPGATLAVSPSPSFIIVANTGVTYAVSNDMTSYFSSITSNTAVTVSNLGPAQIFVGPGIFLEPALTLPPQVNLIGAGRDLTIVTNGLAGSIFISLTASNVLANMTVTCPLLEPVSFGMVGVDNYAINVKTIAQTDGFVNGMARNHIWSCAVTSQWDCIFCPDDTDIRDTQADSVGPWGSGNIVSTALRGGGGAWNSTFNASGSATNRAVNATGGAHVVLNNCTVGTTNAGGQTSYSIYNEGSGAVVTESGSRYDRTATFGAVLHNTMPAGDVLNITGAWSGSTNYLASVDGGSNWFPVAYSPSSGGSIGITQSRTNGDFIETWVNGSLSNSVFFPMKQATNIFVSYGETGPGSFQDTGTVYSTLISNLAPTVIIGWSDPTGTAQPDQRFPIINAVVIATNQVRITLDTSQEGVITATNAFIFFRANQHGNLP